MGVIAGEPGFQVARLVGALRLGDGGEPRGLGEECGAINTRPFTRASSRSPA